MFFAFILLLVVNAVSLSTILLFQCATAKRSNQHRKPQKSQKSTRSRKSSKSSCSGKSGRSSASSTKSGKSSKSGKSGKSKKSGKSYKLKSNPKGNSNKKVQAAILADQKAAQDAINPSLKELASDRQILQASSNSLKKEASHKVSYANVRVIPHEMSFPSIGGLKHVRVKNSSGKRIAFMVKCSDNMLFSINPVFGIIEVDRDAQINILRENGEAKHDKLVIITAAHSDKKKTAEQTFSDLHHTNSHNYNINVVPLLTQ